MKVLITSGGTREPIDGVRSITNFSSGTTGAALADAFVAQGHDVTLLRARDARHPADGRVHQETFVTVADLDDRCRALLGAARYDAVVHAAAVSDFTIGAIVVDGVRHPAPLTGKLDSAKSLTLELVPSPKILPRLRGYAGHADVVIVGFKLTNGATATEAAEAVAKQLANGDVDAVVHNDLTELDHAHDRHPATVHGLQGVVGRAATNAELAEVLMALVGTPA